MKTISKFAVVATAALLGTTLQAHEGHAAVGTVVHDLQHAGWIAATLMLGSVLILLAFGMSVRCADKYMSDKKRQQ
jgi:hypothetical protein